MMTQTRRLRVMHFEPPSSTCVIEVQHYGTGIVMRALGIRGEAYLQPQKVLLV
jgi:hypothetical protein